MKWLLLIGALLILIDGKTEKVWHFIAAIVLVVGAVVLALAEEGALGL